MLNGSFVNRLEEKKGWIHAKWGAENWVDQLEYRERKLIPGFLAIRG